MGLDTSALQQQLNKLERGAIVEEPFRAPAPTTLDELSKSERECFEERSAILEYDAGLSQAEAEKRALAITLQRRQYHDGVSCDGEQFVGRAT